MGENGQIKVPNAKLPKLMTLTILGLVVGVGLISLQIVMELQKWQPDWLWRVLGHIGTATLIATLVGLGIDRIFYHDHLAALVNSMSDQLKGFEKRLGSVIKETLSHMAAGKTLKYLNNSEEIYTAIRSKLEEYPFFTNTIINESIGVPSPYRKEYYKLKVSLVNEGRLFCRELISPNARLLLKAQLDQIDEQKREQFNVRVVELSQTFSSFINFCIFQRNLEDFEGAFLMFGWFADSHSLVHKHTCVISDHPALVQLFSSYFEILERSAKSYNEE